MSPVEIDRRSHHIKWYGMYPAVARINFHQSVIITFHFVSGGDRMCCARCASAHCECEWGCCCCWLAHRRFAADIRLHFRVRIEYGEPHHKTWIQSHTHTHRHIGMTAFAGVDMTVNHKTENDRILFNGHYVASTGYCEAVDWKCMNSMEPRGISSTVTRKFCGRRTGPVEKCCCDNSRRWVTSVDRVDMCAIGVKNVLKAFEHCPTTSRLLC